jgi:hypothetical protein
LPASLNRARDTMVRWPLKVGVAALLVTISWCSIQASDVFAAPSVAPLRVAGAWSASPYELPTLKSCKVGDALTVVDVAGSTALRLTGLQVLYGGGARPSEAHVTYQLISFRRGTTEGQLGATFNLGALTNGLSYGPALGGVLEPLRSSGLWYDLVARVKVIVNHAQPWSIIGLRVTYRSTSAAYASIFRQSVKLPTTQSCASR